MKEVEVVTKVNAVVEEYWVIRGIKNSGNKKVVVAEFGLGEEPNEADIARFLIENVEADFCSVEHNYWLGGFKRKDK